MYDKSLHGCYKSFKHFIERTTIRHSTKIRSIVKGCHGDAGKERNSKDLSKTTMTKTKHQFESFAVPLVVEAIKQQMKYIA